LISQTPPQAVAVFVDPGVACWKWAELVADLYLRLGISHSKVCGYEAPPVVRPLR